MLSLIGLLASTVPQYQLRLVTLRDDGLHEVHPFISIQRSRHAIHSRFHPDSIRPRSPEQRGHQLIVRLHAQGRVRLSDRGKILHIVARSDDPSLLLTHDEERILSALPDEAATTVPRLMAGARMLSARPGSTQFLEPWWPLDGVLRLSDRARRGGAWLVCAGFYERL